MNTDKEKWDERYKLREPPSFEPDPFLQENVELLSGGLALDLASGYGGNALYAARNGYAVHAIDISFQALSALQREARQHDLDLHYVVADLDHYPLPKDTYDLVMVFSFYSEQLMGSIESCLKRGGLLVYSTFNHRHTSVKPEFNPVYLVPPGGLSRFFPNLEIIVDEQYAGDDQNLARLVARRPQ